MKGDFERAKADMEKDAKRASKLEEKVKLLTGGFAARATKDGARAAAAHEAAAQVSQCATFVIITHITLAATGEICPSVEMEMLCQRKPRGDAHEKSHGCSVPA